MNFHKWGLLAVLSFAVLTMLPLNAAAATIDVSSATTAAVLTGDSLTFEVFTWNFAVNAANFGLSPYPTDVWFTFVSAPLDGPATFEAALQSEDGSVSAGFGGPLSFAPGIFTGSGYQGAVSTLQGYLHLSELLSTQLFGPSSMRVMLRNTGPDVTLGLPPYTLPQDLFVSLSASGLTVGALHGAVTLESGTLGEVTPEVTLPDSQVPEPRSGTLLVGGGVLLCLVSRLLNRVGRRRERNRTSQETP
jgi:hypothetical protein